MNCTYTIEHRDAFRERLLSTPVDERAIADATERLGRAIFEPLIGPQHGYGGLEAAVSKAAGYNAGLHGWTRLALRAAAAADAWIDSCGPVDLELSDIKLFEYFLAERAGSRRLKPTVPGNWAELVDRLAAGFPARSNAAGFERAEVDLRPVGPCAGPAIAQIGTLFVASMNNYLNPMLPVMREMLGRGQAVSLLMPEAGLTRWSAAASIPAGVRVITIESLVNSEVAEILERETQRGRATWAIESARILGRARVDDAPLGRFIGRDIEQMVVHTLPHIAAYTKIARRLAGLGVERVVCARLRRAFELSVVRELAAMGAETTMLIHGHISGAPERRFDDGVFRGVDRIAVWGPLQARAIVSKREGARADAIVATGNPAWDALAQRAATGEPRHALRERIASGLGFDGAKPWLAVMGQEDARPQIRRVLEIATTTENLCVLVRPHPRERAESYMALLEGLPADRVRLCTNAAAGLHDLLAAADATITLHSTTNIESLILGTPVITVALGELAAMDRLAPLEDYGLPLATDDATLAVNLSRLADAPNQFRTSLHEAMDRALRDVVTNHAGGHAAEEIADMLRPARKAAAA